MVTIEPIKNQYLTALKERQQIIDKVNEIIRDLNNLNFDDLINLNNKIEEIKTEIVQIENDLSGKVNKNGDIISGSLQLNTDTDNSYIIKRNDLDRDVVPSYPSGDDTNVQTLVTVLDKNNSTLSYIQRSERSIGSVLSHVINQNANGSIRNHQMNQVIGTDGSLYVTIPSWSVGSNDNSDKILTIKMANSLPSLMHTVGNETIAGNKTFMANPTVFSNNNEAGMGFIRDMAISDITGWTRNALIGFFWKGIVYNGYITTTRDPTNSTIELVASNGNNVNASIIVFQPNNGNSGWATAPTTPTNSTSNEIATADWVLSKINELATKNNLNGL